MINLMLLRLACYLALGLTVIFMDTDITVSLAVIILFELSNYISRQIGYYTGMASSDQTVLILKEYLEEITEVERKLKERYGYNPDKHMRME